MKVYKTAVVGCGFAGTAHIEALRRLGNVEVVALANTSGAKEKADTLNIPNYYTDYKEMIDNESLDTIHICTPNSSHKEIVLYAMGKGIHVLCEKPMCKTVTEAEEMVAMAEKTGLINGVNFHNRFYPMACQMKKMIENNKIGKIFSVHGEYVQDWLLYDTDYSWRLEPEFSGETRSVADIGSHWIDLVQTVTGLKVVEVMADFATFYETRKKPVKKAESFSAGNSGEDAAFPVDTEDYANVMFRFENGTIGSAVFSQMVAGRKNRINLCVAGSESSLFFSSEDLNNLFIGHRNTFNQIAVKDPSLVCEESAKLISYPGGHDEGYPDAFKQVFIDFYKSIGDNDYNFKYATFKDGLEEMIICHKIFESAKTGKWVKV